VVFFLKTRPSIPLRILYGIFYITLIWQAEFKNFLTGGNLKVLVSTQVMEASDYAYQFDPISRHHQISMVTANITISQLFLDQESLEFFLKSVLT
jgi:hypothetical protein